MTELIIERALPVTLEPTGDGWTLYGRAVPYEQPQEVTDDGKSYYLEAFAERSFSKDVAKGGRWVNLMVGHAGDEGDRYLGRCVSIQEPGGGLDLAFRIDRTHPLAEEARSGELMHWSVSAHVYRSRQVRLDDGSQVLMREQCGLSHVAATASPQYQGAGVLVARDHELIQAPAVTPLLDAARARLERLRANA